MKKIIRKVLKEEFNSKNYILRRMNSQELEEEFLYALNYLSKGFRRMTRMRKGMGYDTFKNIIVSMMVTRLEQDLIQGGEYDKIKEISDFIYGVYKERIKERYEELTGRQITESKEDLLKGSKKRLVRRLSRIDGYVVDGQRRPNLAVQPCDFKTSEDYIDSFGDWLCENMYYDFFNDLDDTGEEWGEIYHLMKEYIEIKHGENLKQYFENEC